MLKQVHNSIVVSYVCSIAYGTSLQRIIEATLGLLPESDQPDLLHATYQLQQWFLASYANPMSLNRVTPKLSSLLAATAQACLSTYCAAAMRKTAFEQLTGDKNVGDWNLVIQVGLLHPTIEASACNTGY